jgi:hypothetical protein
MTANSSQETLPSLREFLASTAKRLGGLTIDCAFDNGCTYSRFVQKKRLPHIRHERLRSDVGNHLARLAEAETEPLRLIPKLTGAAPTRKDLEHYGPLFTHETKAVNIIAVAQRIFDGFHEYRELSHSRMAIYVHPRSPFYAGDEHFDTRSEHGIVFGHLIELACIRMGSIDPDERKSGQSFTVDSHINEWDKHEYSKGIGFYRPEARFERDGDSVVVALPLAFYWAKIPRIVEFVVDFLKVYKNKRYEFWGPGLRRLPKPEAANKGG